MSTQERDTFGAEFCRRMRGRLPLNPDDFEIGVIALTAAGMFADEDGMLTGSRIAELVDAFGTLPTARAIKWMTNGGYLISQPSTGYRLVMPAKALVP